jgi:hypothetical protein
LFFAAEAEVLASALSGRIAQNVAMDALQRDEQLRVLPDEVCRTARVYENGEVAWPNHHAEAAVNALADAGFLIQGLDARRHPADGGVQETPISDYGIALIYTEKQGLHNAPEPKVEPTVEARRQVALADLPAAFDEGEYVLITYSEPGGPGRKNLHGVVTASASCFAA